jgi:hypothetical protein
MDDKNERFYMKKCRNVFMVGQKLAMVGQKLAMDRSWRWTEVGDGQKLAMDRYFFPKNARTFTGESSTCAGNILDILSRSIFPSYFYEFSPIDFIFYL